MIYKWCAREHKNKYFETSCLQHVLHVIGEGFDENIG
jgi:hypothetical protein